MSVDKLPFQIPKSLASYVEQYEEEPQKTIERFKKQLKRRGSDAVGYFILAWFYYQQNNKEQALECAIRAKNLAPGSPFLEKIHYFFSHPDLFNAWLIDPQNSSNKYNEVVSPSGSSLNSLIEKLSSIEREKLRVDHQQKNANNTYQQPFDKKEVDGIISETLAKVHEEQGNNDTAIQMYQALKNTNKGRCDFYEEKIKELEALRSNKENR